MNEPMPVYQSGETVKKMGTYELVGAENTPNSRAESPNKRATQTAPVRHHLNVGELFPDNNGRAVSWRLVTAAPLPRSEGASM